VRKIYKHGTVLGALAGAMLLVSAQGAMAATEPTTSPEGFGIQGSGLVTVPAQPIATAANPTPACTATVAAGILTANTVCAAVNGNQTTAAVAGLTALNVGILSSGISAGAISSSCTANSDGTFTMASNLANLVIPGAVIPVNPAPNTSLLGGTVILNQQINGPDGATERTVNALVVNLLGQSLTIASSTCGPFVQGAPVAGGKGLALGLGALGAGAVGVTAVKLNRRRRLTNA
jgi:hypothetical protein